MEDKLSKCLNKLFSVLQGELIIGDHDSLSAFGSAEQQKLEETSKIITKLFLKQGYDIEIAINNILDELKKFDFLIQKKSWNSFIGESKTPKIMLMRQYNSTLEFVETLKINLILQESQLLKDVTLLENLRLRLVQSIDEIRGCLDKGEVVLASVESSSIAIEWSLEDNFWKERLVQKISDLRISHTVAVQTLSQIKMLIENNRHLWEYIQVIISKTIPIWEEHMEMIIQTVNCLENKETIRDFEEQLNSLEKMENLNQKIRNALKDIFYEGRDFCE